MTAQVGVARRWMDRVRGARGDLSLSDPAVTLWATGPARGLRGESAPHVVERARQVAQDLYNSGVTEQDMQVVVDAADGRGWDRLVAGEMLVDLYRVAAGLDPRTYPASPGEFAAIHAVTDGLAGQFAAYLDAAWDMDRAHRLLCLGLDVAGANRLASALPDSGSVVLGVWTLVAGAVGYDPAALRVWSWCTNPVGLTTETIRAWNTVCPDRGHVLASAGVDVDEWLSDPSRFADNDTLVLMAGLRR